MMTNGNDTAYPIIEGPEKGLSVNPGLTKLEAFTMAAMQGLLSNKNFDGKETAIIGIAAVRVAKSVIAALNSEEGK